MGVEGFIYQLPSIEERLQRLIFYPINWIKELTTKTPENEFI